MFNAVHETMSGNMSCLSICSEALVSAVPAPEITDEVSAAPCATDHACGAFKIPSQFGLLTLLPAE